MAPKIYYESKKMMYGTVSGLLLLFFILSIIYSSPTDNTFGSLILIAVFMLFAVYLYPAATISLFDDHIEFKKGGQKISSPWKDVVGIHKDPVYAKDIFSYYFAKRFYMGGVFLETTQGYSKYFAPQLIRAEGSSLTWVDLVKDIESRCNAKVREGAVSMFKQKSKLYDIIFILLAVFVVPMLIILIYGIFTGTFSDSIMLVKEMMFSLFTSK